jgi:hypothetical protein
VVSYARKKSLWAAEPFERSVRFKIGSAAYLCFGKKIA